MRYVPRPADPLREPQRITDRAAPMAAGALGRDLLPLRTLPGEATDEESLYRLVNSMRAALLTAGVAIEEE